jgi:hypothetical protein
MQAEHFTRASPFRMYCRFLERPMIDDTYIHKCRMIIVAGSSRGKVGSDQKVLARRLWTEISRGVAGKPQGISCNHRCCNSRYIYLLASATAVLQHMYINAEEHI